YYGVRSGHVPGVYTDWESAEAQIKGFKAPRFRAFPSYAEAEAFTKGDDSQFQAGATPTPKPEHVSPSPAPSSSNDGNPPSAKRRKTGKDTATPTSAHLNKTKWQATTPVSTSPLKIWTDGSSLGNGALGAVAGIGVYFGPSSPKNLSEALVGPRQTNQRAELTALQRALELSPRNRQIRIHTDSNYAIKCVTEWFTKWRQNGWLNSQKKPVENRDLVEKILGLLEERAELGSGSKVEFVWIKGHADDEGNIAADELAVKGARTAKELIARGELDVDDEGGWCGW
ncbi:ribonuclease H-like domain-containing protein, partial [Delphinella strobiligena]